MSKQADSTVLVDDVIRAAAHLEPELEEALNEHGLTRPSYLVLLALLGADDHSLGQRDLMAHVRRTSARATSRASATPTTAAARSSPSPTAAASASRRPAPPTTRRPPASPPA